ncbi:MAG: MFS transporter [Anaerolinea sp.]|nr:MFS transporter [Anaerolinea sp.]
MFKWDKRLWTLFLIVFSNFLGGTIVLPSLPLYAQRHFTASPELISLLLASFFIAQFLAAPFIGRLSDRYGRLPVLVISQFGTFLSFIILGAAATLPVLFAGRILDGITGGNVIVAQAYVTDITTREERTRGLGVIFAAFGLGYILGPALGGLVSAFFNDRATFFVGAAISLLTTILTWLLLDESLTPERRALLAQIGKPKMTFRDVLNNIPLRWILIIGFGSQLSIALLQSSIALFSEAELFKGATEQTVSLGVGLLLTGIGVGQFITQLALIRPAVERFGEQRLVIFGAFFRGLGLLTIPLFGSPWLVGTVSLIMVAVSSGLMMPSLQALATSTVPEGQNGGVLGIYQSATSLGIIVGTALGGQLFAAAHGLPFVTGGIVLWVMIIPALLLSRSNVPSLHPAKQGV